MNDFNLKEVLDLVLPDLTRKDNAVEFLNGLGVENFQDFQHLEEKDLVQFFNLIQSRKLMKFIFQDSEKSSVGELDCFVFPDVRLIVVEHAKTVVLYW